MKKRHRHLRRAVPFYGREGYIIEHVVLGIGYLPCEYEVVRVEWLKHGVGFHFVNSIEEALLQLRQEDYVCITMFSSRIDDGYLEILRSAGPVPVVVLSPECSITQRAEYFQRGAKDYIINMHQQQVSMLKGKDAVQFYLDSPEKGIEPLTIITTADIYFCLEYRSVEVRGQTIDLTAKEFDIFALLITHPRRVFTFDLIMDLVWGQDYSFYSRKTLRNHMSNLRNKLKVQPDVPNYIVSVNSVGFKFDPDAQ